MSKVICVALYPPAMLGDMSDAVRVNLLHVTEVEGRQVGTEDLQEGGQAGPHQFPAPGLEMSHVMEDRELNKKNILGLKNYFNLPEDSWRSILGCI